MGSIEDHVDAGTVDISAGNVKDLRKSLEGLVGVGTAANPVTVKLSAGVYTLDRPLRVPNYCTLVGQGRDATIIQRTVSLTNTAFGTSLNVFCDPVLDISASQSVTLKDLSVIHSGTSGQFQTSTSEGPVAIFTATAKRFKMSNVRIEGSMAGWFDMTETFDNTFSKPLTDDVIGNEDYQYYVDDCLIIGHSAAAALRLARHELYASGCTFLCDVRASDVLQTSLMPVAFHHWEYLVGYFKSCEFRTQVAKTLTVANNNQAACAYSIIDTSIEDSVAYCDNCTFTVDLSEGDVNSSSSGVASVIVSGQLSSGGVLYNYNVFKANGCHFRYLTGASVTSAPYVCGLYLDATSGVSTAVEAHLKDCKFEDWGGAGGTRRRDVVISGRLGNIQAKLLSVENCNIQDFEYRNITGSPVYTHANFLTEPNTMNYQRSSVTLNGGSAAATLPLAFTASAGITDYFVGLEGPAAEIFWWGSKTNTGFTVFSSNTNSTAAVKFVVRR